MLPVLFFLKIDYLGSFWFHTSFSMSCYFCKNAIGILIGITLNLGFPGGSDSKDCLQCKRPRFNPWVGKIPWRRAWQPTPVFSSLENSIDIPGRLQFMRLYRVEHDCATNTFTFHIESKLLQGILDILGILIIPIYEQFPFICAVFNFCNHLLFCRLCSLAGQYPWQLGSAIIPGLVRPQSLDCAFNCTLCSDGWSLWLYSGIRQNTSYAPKLSQAAGWSSRSSRL